MLQLQHSSAATLIAIPAIIMTYCCQRVFTWRMSNGNEQMAQAAQEQYKKCVRNEQENVVTARIRTS